MLANAVKETTATTGSVLNIALTAVAGMARISEAFSVGDKVSYVIKDGAQWEWGIGTVQASNTLDRTVVMGTYVSPTYTTNGATRLTLVGPAEVIISDHSGAWAGTAGAHRTDVHYSVGHGCVDGGYSNQAVVADEFRAFYTVFARPFRVDSLVGYVHTANGTNFKVGIYHDDGGTPGALVVASGPMSCSTTGERTVSDGLPVVLLPGAYWLAFISDGAPSMRGMDGTKMPFFGRDDLTTSSNNAYYIKAAHTYAAGLPDPAPTGLTTATVNRGCPVWLKGANI